MKRKIGIVGASGWIGRELSQVLMERGDEVVGFTRSARKDEEMAWRQWDTQSVPDLSGLDAVINLAGEPIDQRWSAAKKILFCKSRVDLTCLLARGIDKAGVPVFLNASATGFYGNTGDQKVTEKSGAGNGFLADLCIEWEKAAKCSKARVVLLRTGIVLGKGGRAWTRLEKIFKLGLGGRLGNGKQWMPWIHFQDEITAIIHCMDGGLEGPVNLVAPEELRNIEFTEKLARAFHKPAILPAPSFGLRLFFGEFAEEALLTVNGLCPRCWQNQDSGSAIQSWRMRSKSLFAILRIDDDGDWSVVDQGDLHIGAERPGGD